jgi:hypothetical protein
MNVASRIGVNVGVAIGSAYLAFESLNSRTTSAERLYQQSLTGIDHCVDNGLDYAVCAENVAISSNGLLEAIGFVTFLGVSAVAMSRAGRIAYTEKRTNNE